jgi:hypothetical protein
VGLTRQCLWFTHPGVKAKRQTRTCPPPPRGQHCRAIWEIIYDARRQLSGHFIYGFDPQRYLPLSPTRFISYNFQGWGLLFNGQGHNATTVKSCTVVGSVVGLLPLRSRYYTLTTTPQRKKAHTYMYTCAPVRMYTIIPLWALWRCAFIYLFDFIEIKIGRGHNTAHNAQLQTLVDLVKTVVGCVAEWRKPLENINKGGF